MCLVPICKTEERDSARLDSLPEHVSVGGTSAGTNIHRLQEIFSPTHIPVSSQAGAGRGTRGWLHASHAVIPEPRTHFPRVSASPLDRSVQSMDREEKSWRGAEFLGPGWPWHTAILPKSLGQNPASGSHPTAGGWAVMSAVCREEVRNLGGGDTGRRYGAPLGGAALGAEWCVAGGGDSHGMRCGGEGTGPTAQTS